ncbi:hypothetical protein G7Y89_g15703 [Cudoniella acicularis]|uniref:Uncharacterized protein n=1 Tax=Cudoniella acicularis TaxID=354080 RepID=A0A8H4QGQ8_9HELO|nr:hypothetical protein G7Y89_g15703 [Cudoniella acicularis]
MFIKAQYSHEECPTLPSSILNYDQNRVTDLPALDISFYTNPTGENERVNLTTPTFDINFIYSNYLEQLKQSQSGFFLDTNATFTSKLGFLQSVTFGSFYKSRATLWECFIYISYSTVTLDQVSSFAGQDIALGNKLQEGPPRLVDLSSLDNVTFAQRLSTIFNTYIQSVQKSSYSNPGSFLLSTPTPLIFEPFPIMSCDWVFFTTLTVTSIFLTICSALDIWLSYRILTSDILGYVSSMSIENPHLRIPGVPPGSGSALDGLKRAKLLRKMRVQIRDVQETEEFGKLALTNNTKGLPSKSRKEKNQRSFI